jgi:acyl carrier protein
VNPMWIAAFVALVAVGCGIFLHDRVNRRMAERLLARRSQLSPEQFGRTHFGESGSRTRIAGALREILARHIPFALDGLEPDDAFVRDLRMDQLDSLSTVAFLLDVETRFGVTVPDKDAESMRTFRDLVDYLEPRVDSARPGARSDEAAQQRDEADER